jgi:predicted CoA-substrate-specific enzyme activase
MIAMGCDVGSLFTKVALIEDERLRSSFIVRTTGTVGQELETQLGNLCREQKIRRDAILSFGATGRGADLVGTADFVEEEVNCVAAAVAALLPAVDLVIHVGGQSIAVIGLDGEGEVSTFIRNDKCAAGTGRFIEMMGRKLDVVPERIDELVTASKAPMSISNQCVVYAESEAISHLNSGAHPADLFAGICLSVARIATSLGRRIKGARAFTVTGGVGRFQAVTSFIDDALDAEYLPFPLDPKLAAALGAALLDEIEDDVSR